MTLKNIKQQGFTIVELLIVIVVIGILAAITIVAYQNITVQANQKAALANADAVRNAALAYYAENGTYPTVSGGTISGGTYATLPTAITVTGTAPISANNTTILYAVKAGNAGICVGYFPVGGSYSSPVLTAGTGATMPNTNPATCS